MSVFIKKGNFCVVKKNSSEIPEKLFYRGYAIVSSSPKTQKDFDKCEKLSNYLSNIKFLGCSYDDEITKECHQMEEKLNKN